MTQKRCTILLEEDVSVDPRKFGAIVAPALGLTQVEARMAVRKGRGIFLENLSEVHAQLIVAELEKDGIRARLVTQEELPEFPKVRIATVLRHGEDLVSYQPPGSTDLEGVPWEALLLVQLGVVARPEFKDLFGHVPFNMIPAIHKMEGAERELIRENLILKMDSKPPDNRLKNERRPDSIFEEIDKTWGRKVKVFADLVTADLGLWLRVPLDAIAYVYVEGAVKMGGPWGFQLLVNDLVEKCPAALTERALKLLQATDIRDHVFPQLEEYNRLTQWVALKRILWPTAASSSPSPEAPGSPTDAGSSTASPPPAPPSTSS
ncbi:MAG TPA: hypothetical protein VKW04_19860 [Planctomycetota bacterium]|nr:hypothetical protein [Planctomycetota bacterium]